MICQLSFLLFVPFFLSFPYNSQLRDILYSQTCVASQAAAAAEVQTELAARVSSWRHKIQPLLDEQEARPAFDIHSYGDQILDRLASLSCKDSDGPVDVHPTLVSVPACQLQLDQTADHTVDLLI